MLFIWYNKKNIQCTHIYMLLLWLTTDTKMKIKRLDVDMSPPANSCPISYDIQGSLQVGAPGAISPPTPVICAPFFFKI